MVSSAEAQNQFGRVLEEAVAGETVMITKYGNDAAVLISATRYRSLTQEPARELDLLTEQFDRMLAEMQTDDAQQGMRGAFTAAPAEMGKASVEGARRRAAGGVG